MTALTGGVDTTDANGNIVVDPTIIRNQQANLDAQVYAPVNYNPIANTNITKVASAAPNLLGGGNPMMTPRGALPSIAPASFGGMAPMTMNPLSAPNFQAPALTGGAQQSGASPLAFTPPMQGAAQQTSNLAAPQNLPFLRAAMAQGLPPQNMPAGALFAPPPMPLTGPVRGMAPPPPPPPGAAPMSMPPPGAPMATPHGALPVEQGFDFGALKKQPYNSPVNTTAGSLNDAIEDEVQRRLGGAKGSAVGANGQPKGNGFSMLQRLGMMMSPRAQALAGQQMRLGNQFALKQYENALDIKKEEMKQASELERQKTLEGIKHEYKMAETKVEHSMTEAQKAKIRADMVEKYEPNSPQRIAMIQAMQGVMPELANDIGTEQDPETVAKLQKASLDHSIAALGFMKDLATLKPQMEKIVADSQKAITDAKEQAATSDNRVAATNTENKNKVASAPADLATKFANAQKAVIDAQMAGPKAQMEAYKDVQSIAASAADIIAKGQIQDPIMKQQLQAMIGQALNLGAPPPPQQLEGKELRQYKREHHNQSPPPVGPAPMGGLGLSAAANMMQAAQGQGQNGFAIPPAPQLMGSAQQMQPGQAQQISFPGVSQNMPRPGGTVPPPPPMMPTPQQQQQLMMMMQQGQPQGNPQGISHPMQAQARQAAAPPIPGFSPQPPRIDPNNPWAQLSGQLQREWKAEDANKVNQQHAAQQADLQKRIAGLQPMMRPETHGLQRGAVLTDGDLKSRFALYAKDPADYNALIKGAGWTPESHARIGGAPQPLLAKYGPQPYNGPPIPGFGPKPAQPTLADYNEWQGDLNRKYEVPNAKGQPSPADYQQWQSELDARSLKPKQHFPTELENMMSSLRNVTGKPMPPPATMGEGILGGIMGSYRVR